MKVLLIHVSSYWRQMGGSQHVFMDLSMGLKEDPQMEIACAVNDGVFYRRLKEAGIRLYKIPSKNIFLVGKTIASINKIINDFKPDIVHSHHRYTTFVMSVFFKRVKTVHTAHVEMFDKTGISRFGHHVIAVSEAVKKNLINRFNVSEDQISVIYNGVNVRKPAARIAARLREELGADTGAVIIGCVARLEKQKGHAYLLEAVSQLPDEYRKKIFVLMIGDGGLKPFLEKKAQRLKILEHVRFLGYRVDTPELISLCDFTVLPSLWEGLPLVVIESYLLGKPVIATKVSGTPELIIHGKTGLLVAPKDAHGLSESIVKLMSNKSLALEFGKSGYEFISDNFTAQAMCSRHKNLYRRIYEN